MGLEVKLKAKNWMQLGSEWLLQTPISHAYSAPCEVHYWHKPPTGLELNCCIFHLKKYHKNISMPFLTFQCNFAESNLDWLLHCSIFENYTQMS